MDRSMDDPTVPPMAHRVDQWGQWMAAAQSGDRAAYRRLLEAIVPYLRAMAARAASNPADAEDTVQDILMAVHLARHGYDPARPFRPWLAGIARHRIVDGLRARTRRAGREKPLTPAHDGIAAAQTAPPLGETGLYGALARLPATQLLAIRRLKLEERPLRAVSGETGLSIGALKAATARGLRRLRQIMTDEQLA